MASMTVTNPLQGSWFSSGYYGHFRSKSRNDYVNEFRHLAKPLPPQKFMRKSQIAPSHHLFSHHDNRESFLNNALYFQEGLGRKRVESEDNRCISRYNPDLITWMPHKEELEKAPPKHSMYRRDFYNKNSPMTQLYIQRPKTSFDKDQPMMSTYRYAHGKTNPNRETLSAMNNTILLQTGTIKPREPKIRSGRESVASCMSWHVPKPTSESVTHPTLPLATQTYHPTAAQVMTAWE